MNVLTSITVLGFLIFFHEMGHFLAAILQGIYVDGFSIGFGPSIIKKKYKDFSKSKSTTIYISKINKTISKRKNALLDI